MTCKECVHFEQCPNKNKYPFPFDIKQFCQNFKANREAILKTVCFPCDKISCDNCSFAELKVRCEDCRYWDGVFCDNDKWWNAEGTIYHCIFGERKDGVKNG